jgi:hypothetical protein
MKAILIEAKVALLGMQAELAKGAFGNPGALNTYKHMYSNCLDELQGMGLSQKEANKLFCQFLN